MAEVVETTSRTAVEAMKRLGGTPLAEYVDDTGRTVYRIRCVAFAAWSGLIWVQTSSTTGFAAACAVIAIEAVPRSVGRSTAFALAAASAVACARAAARCWTVEAAASGAKHPRPALARHLDHARRVR